MRPIPQAAFAIVRDKEALVLFAYDDAHYPPREVAPGQKIDGTLTAGYGHTGPEVTVGMIVTHDIAEEWLSDDLYSAYRKLQMKTGADIIEALTENQYAALLDFVFNLGTGSPSKPEWTIWKRVRAQQFDQVPLEMAKFVNAGGKKLNGLVDRRNAEIGLWAVSEPGTVDSAPPSSVTRANPTPPTASAPGRSKALIIGAAGTVAGAGPLIDQVTHAIAPYAQHSHYVEKMLGVLAALAAGCAGIGIFYVWLQARNARN